LRERWGILISIVGTGQAGTQPKSKEIQNWAPRKRGRPFQGISYKPTSLSLIELLQKAQELAKKKVVTTAAEIEM
jgi:hypothetical protein